MASPDLQWMILRKQSSFLVKRDGVTFTSEPNNLLAKNSFKFSGLANRKTVGVDYDQKAKKIVLRTKRTKAVLRPKKSLTRTVLAKHVKNHNCKAAVAIRTLTAKSYYRPDLAKYAIGRYHAYHKSLKVDTTKKVERKKRGKKAQKAAPQAAPTPAPAEKST